ncbi:MAG: hypothetical protein ACOYVK_04810 [Bacillota bacterium]
MVHYEDSLFIPLILAITELVKRLGLPKKYAGIFSWALGIILARIYIAPGDFKGAFLTGSVMGLSAAGLFSGTKAAVKK